MRKITTTIRIPEEIKKWFDENNISISQAVVLFYRFFRTLDIDKLLRLEQFFDKMQALGKKGDDKDVSEG